MVTKFDILDRVVWFNTAECRMQSDVVRGIQVIPTGIHRDAEGQEVLDSVAVVYQLESKVNIFETEAFSTEEQALEHYREALGVRPVAGDEAADPTAVGV